MSAVLRRVKGPLFLTLPGCSPKDQIVPAGEQTALLCLQSSFAPSTKQDGWDAAGMCHLSLCPVSPSPGGYRGLTANHLAVCVLILLAI